MAPNLNQFPRIAFFITVVCLSLLCSCKKVNNNQSAFYYWKTTFGLNKQQADLLSTTGGKRLYARFFDIVIDERTHQPVPDAKISFGQPVTHLQVTPVIFITNKTFGQIKDSAVDTLAANSNGLLNRMAAAAGIKYQSVQIDCDWTLNTRDKYFNFLKEFKKRNGRQLQVTIRLHQVKYKEQTGIPPADRGVLMFYNMGKLNGSLQQPSSIYNEADAGKYVAYVSQYPLQLDVALPLFSWSVHISEGRIIGLYANPGKKELSNVQNFEPVTGGWRAKKSCFLDGVYIQENDIFKLEQTDLKTLETAAKQLSRYLPPSKHRTVIYYELGNLNQAEFKAEALSQISADL